jgi:hypothetical protein
MRAPGFAVLGDGYVEGAIEHSKLGALGLFLEDFDEVLDGPALIVAEAVEDAGKGYDAGSRGLCDWLSGFGVVLGRCRLVGLPRLFYEILHECSRPGTLHLHFAVDAGGRLERLQNFIRRLINHLE